MAIVIESHSVPKQEKPTRLSDYCAAIFRTIPSRKGMKKAIDKGLVRLNGKVANTADFVSGGETIELLENEAQNRPEISLELEVLLEDDHLAVIYKPA